MNVISSVFATEKQFQAAAFKCLNNEFPAYRGLVHHIPNESTVSAIERMNNAAYGVIPGVPDLSLPYHGRCWYSELKICTEKQLAAIKAGTLQAATFLSKAQKAWHATYEKTSARIPIYILFPEWDAEHGDWLLQVRRWGRMVREFVR